MKPGPNDVKLPILITWDELLELQRFTIDMAEAHGLDRRIEAYSGKPPIGCYRWDVDCLLAVIGPRPEGPARISGQIVVGLCGAETIA